MRKAKRKDLQKSNQKVEIISPVKEDLQNCQNQQLSQNLETNVSEAIDRNIHLSTQASSNEVENANQLSDSFNNEELLETPSAEHTQAKTETKPKTVDHQIEIQHVESVSSPQQQLTLETVYNQLLSIQNGMEKLQISIDSLREEVNDLKLQNLNINSSQVLEGSRIMQAPSSNLHQQKFVNKQTRSKKLDFNAVIYLQEHGEDKLKEELLNKDNTELTKIIRSEGIKTGKDLKTLEREDMIREIILNGKRRLKQGSVFLKD